MTVDRDRLYDDNLIGRRQIPNHPRVVVTRMCYNEGMRLVLSPLLGLLADGPSAITSKHFEKKTTNRERLGTYTTETHETNKNIED